MADMLRLGVARHVSSVRDMVWHGSHVEARRGKSWSGAAWRVRAGCGQSWCGSRVAAWLGVSSRCGRVWQGSPGLVGHVTSRRVQTRFVAARRGEAVVASHGASGCGQASHRMAWQLWLGSSCPVVSLQGLAWSGPAKENI